MIVRDYTKRPIRFNAEKQVWEVFDFEGNVIWSWSEKQGEHRELCKKWRGCDFEEWGGDFGCGVLS